MRNKYAGHCYKCGKMVAPGEGHFERHKGKWDVIHVNCVFEQREEKALKKGVAADGEAQ